MECNISPIQEDSSKGSAIQPGVSINCSRQWTSSRRTGNNWNTFLEVHYAFAKSDHAGQLSSLQ